MTLAAQACALTIVGGGREAWSVWRRGSREKLCARGACPAWSCGPSTSPLDVTYRNPRMPLTKLLTWGFALFVALPCIADPSPLQSKPDVRALAESVMKLVAANKIDDAFGKLKPYWPLPPNEVDTLILKTISMRNTVGDRFGPTTGYAFVREDAVGDFLVRYTYVEKRQKHPLRWTFIFYRAANNWTVDGASWDDNVSLLFSQ